MSEIKNGGLDQYDSEPFEQQQLGTAGIERVKYKFALVTVLDLADAVFCIESLCTE